VGTATPAAAKSHGNVNIVLTIDDHDEEPVVIYHSHTATEAYPSRTDVTFAGEPGAHYLLVSTREPESEEIRSFRIVDGVVTEEKVNIVDATVDA
jgi:proteasome lid subunit RPN8/RPN11